MALAGEKRVSPLLSLLAIGGKFLAKAFKRAE